MLVYVYVLIGFMASAVIQHYYNGNPFEIIGRWHQPFVMNETEIYEKTWGKYSVSLLTITNPHNHFYYHTTLLLQKKCYMGSILHQEYYGLFPDVSKSIPSKVYRFFRSFLPIKAIVKSPDPLYLHGKSKLIHRETITLTKDSYHKLRNTIKQWDGDYSYFGIFGSENCASWARKIFNKLTTDSIISCNSVKLLGYNIPILFFDFPYLCKKI